jgi:translation initiation factor IF-2
MLSNVSYKEHKVAVIYSQVGAITESDITFAKTANAHIIGFNLRPNANIRKYAEENHVTLDLHTIIYRITEEILDRLKGSLKKEQKEIVIGQLEVREVYNITKVGQVAGCYVTDGYVTRDALCRITRHQVIIFEGHLASLKRFKDEVKEVKAGFECGVAIANFNEIAVGDLIEASKMEDIENE